MSHHGNNTSGGNLTHDDLANLVFSQPVKDKEFTTQILENIATCDAGLSTTVQLINALRRTRTLKKISLLSYEIAEGRSKDDSQSEFDTLIASLQDGIDSGLLNAETSQDFVTDDLDELINDSITTPGLRWRLDTLNKMMGSLRKGDFGFVFARPECLAPETPVLFYDGSIKEAHSIRIGDKLMGDDSTSRVVTSITSGIDQMYRITYSWGESYTVNENHILSLKRSKVEAKHNYGDILNVTVGDYLLWPEGRKQRYKGWKTAVEYPAKELKIPPYLLGLWLGDGTSDNTNFTNADPEVLMALKDYAFAYGLECKQYVRENQGKAYTIALTGVQGKANPFREDLRYYSVFKNKHIPFDYLTGSREQRLQLLAGIIDTDGCVARQGFEIVQVRRNLAEQILSLARSLGLHGSVHKKIINGTSYWRLHLYGDVACVPCRIERKKHKNNINTKRKGLQFGFTVEPLGLGMYCGFTLTGNHLFVLGDYTVTHNTGKTTFLASEVTYMAEQLTEASGPILWLNNEEQGSKVMLRCYQASLGLDLSALYSNIEEHKKQYARNTHGKIKLYDSGIIHRNTVEKLCKQYKPSLIIFDQIGKITGFNKDREDLVQGAIYQWARELAKEYCPVIGVCQADGSGEGVRWLTMSNVADAKTAKQAEADWILGIGKVNDPGFDNLRFLHLSKNKLVGDPDTIPDQRHGRREVLIEPHLARYKDI